MPIGQFASGLARDRRGGVAVMTAALMAPTLMMVALAVDYGFYIQAQAQLALAADTAGLHAARVASQAYAGGDANAAVAAGQTAGQQWFAAQAGQLPDVSVPPGNVSVTVTYNQSPPGFSSVVGYNATISSHLAGAFGFASFANGGSARAVVSNAYVEVLMLLDKSGSMLIGATTADIVALEKATPCSTQAASAGQDMGNYAWTYSNGYSYGGKPPPASPVSGACRADYTGDPAACFYAPQALAAVVSAGKCTNGGGSADHTPQAPCAFACHNSAVNNDYYGLARSLKLTLRLDVVEQAAASVIKTLQSKLQSPGQFLVGVYEFNNALTKVYPTSGTSEAGTDLAAALAQVQALSPDVTMNSASTNFQASANSLASATTAAGDGTTQAAPRKNLFVVTDGMQDALNGTLGPMTSASNEQTCKQFKDKGVNVYVLYTPYLPLPNPWYLDHEKSFAEPPAGGGDSPILAALRACASSPANFFQASDPAAINTALQAMLFSALNAPARVAQ